MWWVWVYRESEYMCKLLLSSSFHLSFKDSAFHPHFFISHSKNGIIGQHGWRKKKRKILTPHWIAWITTQKQHYYWHLPFPPFEYSTSNISSRHFISKWWWHDEFDSTFLLIIIFFTSYFLWWFNLCETLQL